MIAARLGHGLTALGLPVLAGLAFMVWQAAPLAFVAVNAAVLAVSLPIAAFLPMPTGVRSSTWVAIASLAIFWAATLGGVSQEGVRRWLSVGPITLHAGYLVLPLLAVLIDRLASKWAATALAFASLAAALQPDLATDAGLAALTLVSAARRRDAVNAAALVVSAGCLIAALQVEVRLAPVRFVEFVPQQAWAATPLAGLALVAAQLAGLGALLAKGARATGLAAFLLGCMAVSWLLPYPSLLIGYGAAPILGLGLALAALR
ncbi:MAG: hypothetical protein ACKOOL_13565 [Novosphingobium sp.]